MKQLNNYILEKLHLNKNIVVKEDILNIGDPVCIMRFINNYGCLDFSIYSLAKVIKIHNNIIEVQSSISSISFDELILNEHNIYEAKHGDTEYLFLTMNQSIEILTLVRDIYKKIKNQKELYNYFTKRYYNVLDKEPILYHLSDKGYNIFIERFKHAEID